MYYWLQITSGRGPAECSWVVFQMIRQIKKEAEKKKIQVELLESIDGEYPKTCRSVLLSLRGKEATNFIRSWSGTVQWIGTSPFRPKHKRKNWFIGVQSLAPPEKLSFSERDLKVETMRASGPGGQHVNKSETAVRITHQPTDLSVTAQEERSQQMNKKLALAKLQVLFEEKQSTATAAATQNRWSQHNELERGNPVRIYKGFPMKRVVG